MMSGDPWTTLTRPDSAQSVSARRVDETTRWDFYWATDNDAKLLLILRHAPVAAPRNRLPRLKGIEIFEQPPTSKEKPALVLRLLDSSLRDIFYRLCLDIIGSTSPATSESEAIGTAIARTWRWHHLLRGGGGPLSVEEQIGLLGELSVLERYLFPTVSLHQSIASWLGPLGAPQDFVVGRTGIESKARGGTDTNDVRINSEYQLDDSNLDRLFIHLCVFQSPTQTEADGFSLTDVASRIRTRVESVDNKLVDRYDSLLAAAGFRYEDDYSSSLWIGGERSIYKVVEPFPRLVTRNIPGGTSGVRYTLSLRECGGFLVSPDKLEKALIDGATHAN
jgi:hypothetical protein